MTDNITLRKQFTRENEYEPIINDVKGHSLLEENNNSLEDISLSPRRSLPDLSTRDYDDEYIQLKQKIEALNSKLASAHTEIENLHMEKNVLQKEVHEQKKSNSALYCHMFTECQKAQVKNKRRLNIYATKQIP
ncbi:unnamed protein product [Parnassius apollo]|uniref:(apollo) hypothetical protein n=1 Tax=Parnassius apollo TaxID=110799 RepID=A0A8S3W895_PARAO|nr:unnamed protein product [Parnassius apollo]